MSQKLLPQGIIWQMGITVFVDDLIKELATFERYEVDGQEIRCIRSPDSNVGWMHYLYGEEGYVDGRQLAVVVTVNEGVIEMLQELNGMVPESHRHNPFK